ncbi:MAG: DUF4412 domain-containing protein [Acetobacteraceae bacterium]|nr:DUF4412 domain-containing protein [Acetobacteraceae bacterium]MDW8399922.1 DUF4412 domain-containing protein [Acetobacteraceae bacterium]
MKHAALAAALALAAPAVAAAQTAPQVTPTRDVAVTYRVSGAGPVQSMRWSWLVSEQLMRLDMPGGPGWMLINTREDTAFVVMEQQRMVMRVPREQAAMLGPNALRENTRFTRLGSATVAGLACTTWRVESPQGEGEACITEDGVLLRGRGRGGQGDLEATEVRYGRPDPAMFRLPEGLRVVELPGGPPPGSPAQRR